MPRPTDAIENHNAILKELTDKLSAQGYKLWPYQWKEGKIYHFKYFLVAQDFNPSDWCSLDWKSEGAPGYGIDICYDDALLCAVKGVQRYCVSNKILQG